MEPPWLTFRAKEPQKLQKLPILFPTIQILDYTGNTPTVLLPMTQDGTTVQYSVNRHRFKTFPRDLSPLRPRAHCGCTMRPRAHHAPAGATPILRMNSRACCECVEVLECSGNGLRSKPNLRLMFFFRIHPQNWSGARGCMMRPRAQDAPAGATPVLRVNSKGNCTSWIGF